MNLTLNDNRPASGVQDADKFALVRSTPRFAVRQRCRLYPLTNWAPSSTPRATQSAAGRSSPLNGFVIDAIGSGGMTELGQDVPQQHGLGDVTGEPYRASHPSARPAGGGWLAGVPIPIVH
eukprot:scaffold136693_cov22-Tisochrysis_lutea.AAC.1